MNVERATAVSHLPTRWARLAALARPGPIAGATLLLLAVALVAITQGAADIPARTTLGLLAEPTTAPSLLTAYGADHSSLDADQLERFQPDYTAAGQELAGGGRTTVVLLPEEGDTKLEEEEVEPLLGEPEDEGNVIYLGDLIGWLFFRKHIVPNDSRIVALALDPRNSLVRELISAGRGRVFAFPRQLEAFALGLRDYQVLYYRARLPAAEGGGAHASIEVRARRSGDLVPTAAVASRGVPSS